MTYEEWLQLVDAYKSALLQPERLKRNDRSIDATYCADSIGELLALRHEVEKMLVELRSERDEWRAKAEGSSEVRAGSSNLEWVYGHDGFFNRFARWYVTDGGMANDTDEADEWLMAERVDDSGQNADMSENAPDCVRDDASASENGVSADAEGSNDTREKLVGERAERIERLERAGR